VEVNQLFNFQSKAVFFAQASRTNPDRVYLAETFGLATLSLLPDGKFARSRFLELPDSCTSFHEDSSGRLWIGTYSKGAFIYDPSTQQLLPVADPANR